jgi:hypothetical protein
MFFYETLISVINQCVLKYFPRSSKYPYWFNNEIKKCV